MAVGPNLEPEPCPYKDSTRIALHATAKLPFDQQSGKILPKDADSTPEGKPKPDVTALFSVRLSGTSLAILIAASPRILRWNYEPTDIPKPGHSIGVICFVLCTIHCLG
jgi:hypothetical protein